MIEISSVDADNLRVFSSDVASASVVIWLSFLACRDDEKHLAANFAKLG